MAYNIKDVEAPRIAGPMLKALARVLETPGAGALAAKQFLGNVGVPAMRAVATSEPALVHPPLLSMHDGGRGPSSAPEEVVVESLDEVVEHDLGAPIETAAHFTSAYRAGAATPEQVAERVLLAAASADRLSPPMRFLISQRERDLREQAKASARRWEEGEPLGPLDGVPVAIKDEIEQRPYPTTVGTTFLGRAAATEDAEVVARLRAAGALLIGKANMIEIGLGVIGHQPHYGAPRNPYDPRRACSGSSSGSAAAVAAGLCPIAIGADAGGSIRNPSAICGQVGLKPTYGRVSEHGAAQLCWSLAHVGPIAATVRDVALAYAVIAGPDEKDPNTLGQPSPSLRGVFADDSSDAPLDGVKLGIYRPWFEHADAAVVARCYEAVDHLVEAGAQLVDIDIPDLGMLSAVHLVTIVSEMVAGQLAEYGAHRGDYSDEIRSILAVGQHLQGADYVHAQRLRARICRNFAKAFEAVDAIVTPTTGCTAPTLSDNALETGEFNLGLTTKIIRFVQAANLTGHPAISIPAGYDGEGLPVGLQLMGRHWGEDHVLRIAAVAERFVKRRKPKVHYSLLDEAV